MLFAASDSHAWAAVRVLALAAAGQVPGTAAAVVGLEAQRLGVAPMQVAKCPADGGFTATASLERDGARVEGKAGLRRQQEDRAAGRGAVAAGSPLLEFGQLGPQAPDLAVDARQLRPGLLFADVTVAVPARASASPSRRLSLSHGVPPRV